MMIKFEIHIFQQKHNLIRQRKAENMNLQKPSPSQLTSFEKAVINNVKESLEKHLSNNNISQSQLNQALFLGIQNFRVDDCSEGCLLLLLRHKASPNCIINGETPLVAACKTGQLEIVKLLVEYGAKPDLPNQFMECPLEALLCTQRENYDIARYLINVLPTVNFQLREHQVPIVLALKREFLRIFSVLIHKGASLVFEEDNLLHKVCKKKFNSQTTKKKFIRQLNSKPFLIVQDRLGKIPFDYLENQEMENYCFEQFKPKLQKSMLSDSASTFFSHKEQELKKITPKDTIFFESLKQKENIQNKFKKNKDEDTSFSEFDDEQQQQKIPPNKEDEQIIEVIEEEQEKGDQQVKKKADSKNIKSILNNSSIVSNNSSFTAPKKNKKVVKNQSVDIQSRKSTEKKKNIKNFSSLLGRKKSSKDRIEEKKEQVTKIQAPEQKRTEVQTSLEHQDKKKSIDQNRQTILQKYGQILQQQKRLENIISDEEQVKQKDQSNNLSHQLSLFLVETEKKLGSRSEKIQNLIELFEKVIKNTMESMVTDKVAVKIYVYGSQATGLAIEESDVDLLVVVNGFHQEQILQILQLKKTLQLQEIEHIKYITTASVPIIKIETGQAFKGLKVDLTFECRNHGGLRCTQLLKSFISSEITLKPMVIFLKTLIYNHGLNDPYTGGIGSYALTLMIIGLLQFTELQKKVENLPNLLFEFFYFYGEQLDYIGQAIIIQPPGYIQIPFTVYHLPFTTDLKPRLVIYDPLNPNNNVGRTTYRIAALKKLFSLCYYQMKISKCSLKALLNSSSHTLLAQYN